MYADLRKTPMGLTPLLTLLIKECTHLPVMFAQVRTMSVYTVGRFLALSYLKAVA